MKAFASILVVISLATASSFAAVNITLKAKIGSNTYTGIIPGSAFTPGVAMTVQVWAQDTVPGSGVLGVAGDIVASGAACFSTPTSGATWTAPSLTGGLYDIGSGDGTPGAQIGSYKAYDSSTSFAGSLPAANVIRGDYITTADVCTGYTIPTTAVVANQGPVLQAVDANGNYTVTGWNVGGIPGANGRMFGLGSGQNISANPNRTLGNAAPILVCSYTFNWNTDSIFFLSWVDSGKANAAAHGGWFTCGTAMGDDGVGTISNLTNIPEPATLCMLAVAGLLAARRRTK